jgi:uncharacterized membrane protein YcaP (DUF421 family)
MDAAIVGTRAIFTFTVLLILLRISGKRIVAESSVFDFVLALIVGDLVDDVFFGEQPVSLFIAAIGTLIILEIILRLLSQVNPKIHRFLEGKPVLLVKDGMPIFESMKKNPLAHKELRAMLRLDGLLVRRWKEIKISLLEQNGHSSVIRKNEYKEAQKADLQR